MRPSMTSFMPRIRATVNPIDTVYEMFVADVVYLEWEVLRWRRQKSSLMRVYQIKALEKFLSEELDYGLYAQDFGHELASTLRTIFRKTKRSPTASGRVCPK